MIGVMKQETLCVNKEVGEIPDSEKVEGEPQENEEVQSTQEKQPVTVFDEQENFNCIHPLQQKWHWTIDRHDHREKEQMSWGSNTKKLAQFDSVEGFWGYETIYLLHLHFEE